MQNKQLQRQLKVIVQNLNGNQILNIIDSLQKEEVIILNKNFTKSGINCTCCTLTHDKITATGFGRNQHQALINATKNYMETLIATNAFVPQLRLALRQRDQKSQNCMQLRRIQQKNEQTLVFDQMKGICDLSQIKQEQIEGCTCIYYEVHKHHLAQIKNIQARMKLIIKQNEMLKQLLLKDIKKDQNKNVDKQNFSWKANVY